MEKNKFEKERETIIFSIWQVFRKSHNISERYHFWTRKHIEVGLNFSLAAGSDVMYLCFYVFWKCPGKFFAWTLLVESWSTGRRIHNSRSYVFMFFMYLCLPIWTGLVKLVARLQARQPHQKRPTNSRHWTFVQQMDGPKKVDRSTFEMLTLKSTFKMLTLKSTFFGISM